MLNTTINVRDIAVAMSSAVTGMLVGTTVKKVTDNNTAACAAGASTMIASHVAINKSIDKIKIKLNKRRNNLSEETTEIVNA